MNLPNRLTLLRVAMTPVVLALLLLPFRFHFLLAAAAFGAASLTDLFDGKIARRRNIVTNFGKLMDPLADKMLITAGLVGLMAQGLASPWVVFLILLREFAVTSLRLIAAGEGTVIAAVRSGKAKTVLQITSLAAVMCMQEVFSWHVLPAVWGRVFALLGMVLLWAAAAITLLSGLQIFWANRRHFKAL